MEDADPVGRREPVADPLGDREAPAERKYLLFLLDVLERPPREVFHRHELLARDLDEVVHAADVLVRDPSREDDLASQRLAPLRRKPIGPNALQRNLGVELQVVRPVDDAHAAEAEDLIDAVAAAENGSRPVGNFTRCGRRGRRHPLARGTLAFPGHV